MAATHKEQALDAGATSSLSTPARSNTTLTLETAYVRMLLELQDIHWGYNALASFAGWTLLAGYLVIPGTFTSLQKSESLQENVGNAVLKTIQNPPLVGIAWTFLTVGAGTMGLLFYRWRDNYLWLINRLFIPTFLNTAAGLLTTIINIYTAKDGYWSIMAVLTVVSSGTLAAAALVLTAFYKFWKLRAIQKEHDSETEAGNQQVFPMSSRT
ncbi:uncharacterized protein BDV14DRAFT_182293 [Aspergillus stella-maris]|uniref:uncharacterized protein n=1 Tax=Aspergillus stella-maris TaxID=1810926 RepID=UPI003CCD0AB3